MSFNCLATSDHQEVAYAMMNLFKWTQTTGVNILTICPVYILPSDIFEMGKIYFGDSMKSHQDYSDWRRNDNLKWYFVIDDYVVLDMHFKALCICKQFDYYYA